MKRIASLQDFSCFGRCSLTVALPVISAMGMECAAVPTALLSAHSALSGFVRWDLTDCLAAVRAHWQAMGLRFDAICTGYLSCAAQAEQILAFFDAFAETPLIFVDPAMGDDGALYDGLDAQLPAAMAALCARAQVVVPNVTEACLLTGTPYQEHFRAEELLQLLRRLRALGAENVVITGIAMDDGSISTALLDSDGAACRYAVRRQSAALPGTGDVFSAACAGALCAGWPLALAVALAADFTVESLRRTLQSPQPPTYGVEFEAAIPYLLRRFSREEAPEGEFLPLS